MANRTVYRSKIVEVVVDKESIAIIRKFPSNLKKEIRKGMETIASRLQQSARMRAPIITGHLRYGRPSLRPGYGPGGIFASVSRTMEAIKLESLANYAAIVEERKPHLQPAIDAYLPKAEELIAYHLGKSFGE